MPAPFVYSALELDLSPRVQASTVVVASPSANAETIVASVSLPADLQFASGVFLIGWAAFTVGTNGVSSNLRIRQTSVSGSIIAASGAATEVAANLDERNVHGFDTAPAAGQIYKLTLTVGSGSAASTVSAVSLAAIAV